MKRIRPCQHSSDGEFVELRLPIGGRIAGATDHHFDLRGIRTVGLRQRQARDRRDGSILCTSESANLSTSHDGDRKYPLSNAR